MPHAGTASTVTALWAFAGILLLLCVLPLLYSTTGIGTGGAATESVSSRHHRQFQSRQLAVPDERRGPAHSNPLKAPPHEPLAFEALTESEPSSAELAARSSFLSSRRIHHEFGLSKRDALRCDDGPCVDDSCCGKDKICGFGPDFCGDGCRSNCNATAMCGEYSENADMPCGMKLCCSAMGWCGTTSAYCHNADPLRGTLPCQAGYGSCYITGSPSCPYGGGSTNGRHIGYYQSWNVRNRVCNKVSPKQLNTAGYTHLFYSFASINPVAFTIAPAHSDDPAMMREFTGLAKPGLKTWIAIGGFDFSDKGTPTHHTWSELCANKARRTAFISSVKNYMDEYGFTGVDLDWEYPGDPDRGGNKLADTRNLVLLVKEMRAAYGNNYGISLTLAPDYWYLRWFDAKAMEPFVDFFGFMAYDLHGSWDADVKALGKKVRGQADIREIADNTVPLWFDGLNPAKLNFGLAMYGRGYTLADPTCNQLLCPFASASKPAPCTNFDGVMSLLEIQQLIKRKGLQPQYLPDSMMKQITWDDQWIGYDDEETFAAKKAWADSKCFGGTMVWSIDFQVTGSGDSDDEKYGEVAYIGSEVFQTPTAQCPAPCVMVFPSSALPEPKVITMQPYTATLEVGTTTTTMVAIASTSTTTVTVVNFFNHYVTSAQQPGAVITLRPSFQPPPVMLVVTGQDGQTTTRTVVPPPLGGGYASGNGGSNSMGTTSTNTDLPSHQPTTVPEIEIDPPALAELEEWEDDDIDPPTPVFPSEITNAIEPVTDTNKPTPPGSTRVKCNTWFFFICISWIDLGIHVEWWDIVLPPGPIGPGPLPPGAIKLPKGWSIPCLTLGCLPVWPKMTIGPGGVFPPEPPAPTPCEPVTATLTIESTSYGTTTTEGTVRTVTTRTFSSEFPILGCALTDVTLSTSKTACAAAQPTPRAVDSGASMNAAAGDNQHVAERGVAPLVVARDDCDANLIDMVVFPSNHRDSNQAIKEKLQEEKNAGNLGDFTVIESPDPVFVAFIYLKKIDKMHYGRNLFGQHGLSNNFIIITPPPQTAVAAAASRKRQVQVDNDNNNNNIIIANTSKTTTGGLQQHQQWHKSVKREASRGANWGPSHLGIPPNVDFMAFQNGFRVRDTRFDSGWSYKYQRDSTECDGQFVYIIENALDASHSAFANVRAIETLPHQQFGSWYGLLEPDAGHATAVASIVAGRLNGVCPKGQVTLVTTGIPGLAFPGSNDDADGVILIYLEALVEALKDIKAKGRARKSVINMSWSMLPGAQLTKVLKLVLMELDELGVVLVCSAGNARDATPGTIDRYPALFGTDPDLSNLIVVGSSTEWSRAAAHSKQGAVTVYAPGEDIMVASAQAGEDLEKRTGTSYAAPAVAGLVAYWRALRADSHDFDEPANVKSWLRKTRRRVWAIDPFQEDWEIPGEIVSPVWNGMLIHDLDCIHNPQANPNCPDLRTDTTPLDDRCAANIGKRQTGFCTWTPPGDGDGGDGDGGGDIGGQDQLGPSKTFTYRSGTPSPTCTSSCGSLCTDFWCRPDRTGQPSHFTEPTRLPSTTPAPIGGGSTIPTNCISSTTTTTCHGDRQNQQCAKATVCLATANPSATPSPSSAVDCSTNTECFGALGGPTTVTTCVSSLSCAGSPATAAPTPLSGFPSPSSIPGVAASCMGQSECEAHPGLTMACDAAAEHFTGALGPVYGYGTGTLPSWVCRMGNYFSLTRGGLVGCRIKFERLTGGAETPENVCMWQHGEARQWYANMRAACRGEGYACGAVQMMDSETTCAMTVEYVSSCEGLADGFG